MKIMSIGWALARKLPIRLPVLGASLVALLLLGLAPSPAQAWFGRCHSHYYPGYSYGYSNYYRPAYYGYSNYGCSNYGYSGGYSNYGYGGYGTQYGGMPYGMNAGFGGTGFGGNSALTTVLAMSAGLGGANSSMYMTVPMSNGYGPASLLQVPLGGSAGRPTYLQVPMGGGPGQPIYLQMELGGGSASPAPVAPTPRSVGSTPVSPSDRVVADEGSSTSDVAFNDALLDGASALQLPYVVLQTSAPELNSVASTDVDDAAVADSVLPLSALSTPFRFAVFQKPTVDKAVSPTPPTVAQATVVQTPRKLEPVAASDELAAEPSLSDSSVPWAVKK